MMFANYFLSLIFLIRAVWPAAGHSEYMTQTYCSTPMTPGTNIMGSGVVTSTTRSLIVKRGSTTLTTGSTYNYGETLSVSISSTSGEYLLESSGASFSQGKCTSGTRIANAAGSLVMPSSGSTQVTIKTGWATGQSTVSVTPTFVLIPALGSATPTSSPGVSPSPTSTGAPSLTFHPSAAPTTSSPTTAAVINNGGSASVNSQSNNVMYGKKRTTSSLAISIVGTLAVVLITGYWYIMMVEHGQFNVLEFMKQRVFFYAACAFLMGCFSLAFIAAWARSDTANDFSYLGIPNAYLADSTNPSGLYAWHPVLMVGGFLCSQVFAASVWTLLGPENRVTAKYIHIALQSAGLLMMGLGVSAIVHSERAHSKYAQTYTTMHSILGMAAIVAFVLNYTLGSTMYTLTNYLPQSLWRKHIDLRNNHRKLGGFALILTGMAIVTGIMNQLPMGACFPPSASDGYEKMPNSCKIGLGLGVLVFLAIFFVLLTPWNAPKSPRWRQLLPPSPHLP